MTHIRSRDMRAIAFCLIIVLAVFVTFNLAFDNVAAALAAAAACAAWLATRPRMVRITRRLRGDTGRDWSAYYRD